MHLAVPERFAASWPAEPSSVPAARHAVVAHLEEAGTPEGVCRDVALALSEAVSNVVTHAYLDAEAPGDVRVEVRWTVDELELVVEDDGRGLRPRDDSPGLGLGLGLIAKLTSRMTTSTAPGQGTRMCMWFRRDVSG